MIVLLLFILLLIPDLYVWHHFLRHAHWLWQVLYWSVFAATLLFMTLIRTPLYEAWMFRCGMTLLLCFSVPKMLFTLFSLVGLLAGRIVPAASRCMDAIGGVVAVAVVGIVVYGLFFGWKKLAVNEYQLAFDDLPHGFDGYTIVHLSDMHIGTYLAAPEMVDSVVKQVNAINPDMICFTGDLVNASPKELEQFMPVLKKLHARDGIYSIMGNHDYCTYDHDAKDSPVVRVRRLQTLERELGWQMLNNVNVTISHAGDSIMLAGVENSSKPPFPDYGDLKKALTGVGDMFCILLSHDPTHWQREVLPKSAVQLQLSGHTHSTQFRMFGWSPASFTYKEYGGLYEMLSNGTETFNPENPVPSSRKLFVSTGTGGNLPFRVGVPPEVVVLRLKATKVMERN